MTRWFAPAGFFVSWARVDLADRDGLGVRRGRGISRQSRRFDPVDGAV